MYCNSNNSNFWSTDQLLNARKRLARTRVPGLPIWDCARGCNNCDHRCSQLSAKSVTGNTFFERSQLVLGLRKILPWVNCPYVLTTPTIHLTTISWFLSPSNLSNSRYHKLPGRSRSSQIFKIFINPNFQVVKWEFMFSSLLYLRLSGKMEADVHPCGIGNRALTSDKQNLQSVVGFLFWSASRR